MRPPDAAEVARRVRAARAYAKLGRLDLAKAIDFHPSTLDEIEGKRARLRGATWEELWLIADACGVPREFFSADLGRLWEIVPDDLPHFTPVDSPRDAAVRAVASTQEAAQRQRERRARGSATTADQDAPETHG